MKSLINVKSLLIILVSLTLIVVSTSVFASDLVLGNGNGTTTLTGNEYDNAQTPDVDNNTKGNISTNNTVNNTVNNAKTYNTNNKTDLPQTGIEDYNIGILLVICIGASIFTYKKMKDYKNV